MVEFFTHSHALYIPSFLASGKISNKIKQLQNRILFFPHSKKKNQATFHPSPSPLFSPGLYHTPSPVEHPSLHFHPPPHSITPSFPQQSIGANHVLSIKTANKKPPQGSQSSNGQNKQDTAAHKREMRAQA